MKHSILFSMGFLFLSANAWSACKDYEQYKVRSQTDASLHLAGDLSQQIDKAKEICLRNESNAAALEKLRKLDANSIIQSIQKNPNLGQLQTGIMMGRSQIRWQVGELNHHLLSIQDDLKQLKDVSNQLSSVENAMLRNYKPSDSATQASQNIKKLRASVDNDLKKKVLPQLQATNKYLKEAVAANKKLQELGEKVNAARENLSEATAAPKALVNELNEPLRVENTSAHTDTSKTTDWGVATPVVRGKQKAAQQPPQEQPLPEGCRAIPYPDGRPGSYVTCQ